MSTQTVSPTHEEIMAGVEQEVMVGVARRKLASLEEEAKLARARADLEQHNWMKAQDYLKTNYRPKHYRSLADHADRAVEAQRVLLQETIDRKYKIVRSRLRFGTEEWKRDNECGG